MTYYSSYQPKAKEESIVKGDHFRFTILTSQLIRVEYSPSGVFNEFQTQTVLNRLFDPVNFDVFETETELKIQTDHVLISYDKKRFSREGLQFKLRGNFSEYHSNWAFGEPVHDLKGTARTLDMADGEIPLDSGIISRYGFSILDDSGKLILTEEGWYQRSNNENIDFYYFGYGHDYLKALKDYYRLTGPQPLLPRYAFGNWWSRFYKYSEETYKQLITKFEQLEIPFTVAVIDMDWHLVDIPERFGSGWTGFTWNQELFPDPEEFLQWLHDKGYRITLNVHPAEGIRPHEVMYQTMAEELGIDWQNEQFILFDPTNRSFLDAYFRHVNHYYEDKGVDFWWLDWQQGDSIKGIDPLWVINHYHYLDNEQRNGKGLTFSRYAGPGSHRYPVGFSGDTHITWKSLQFQPYFTATASNIGYGWWSHDIGGHMFGEKDNELFLRWLQFGVYSPIMRLHSSSSEFLGKEPWNYPQPYQEIIINYLRLRHSLIPYLFTMNYRSNKDLLPLILPLYYFYPKNPEAYNVPNQYFFGSELMVLPVTEKVSPLTHLAPIHGWLPEGRWYDCQSGLKYEGNREMTFYRGLDSLPIFASEGSIVPYSNDPLSNSIENPKNLLIEIFTGKDANFELIEETDKGKITKTTIHYQEDGYLSITSENPQKRNWTIRLVGRKIPQDKITSSAKLDTEVSNTSTILRIDDCEIVDLSFISETVSYTQEILDKCFNLINQAEIENIEKEKLWKIVTKRIPNTLKISEIVSVCKNEDMIGPLIELLSLT